MKNNIIINKEQKLYVISEGNAFSCLGFTVCFNRAHNLNKELHGVNGPGPVLGKPGTLKLYKQYQQLINEAKKLHVKTGWRSKSELIPEFIGNEGRRVQVVTSYGTTERFIIGKSTGFIPTHLEIKKSNSSGGIPVCGYPFKQITFLS